MNADDPVHDLPRPAAAMRWVLPAILRMVALGLAALALGAVLGVLAGLWFAVFAFGLLLFFHLYYLARLGRWVERPRLESIPEGYGAWAEVFSRLYRDRRASERNKKALVENEERFRRTIGALPQGIVLVDASLQIEWCNPVAEQHLGIHLLRDQGLRLTNLVRDPAFVGYITSGRFSKPLTFAPLAASGLVLSVLVVAVEAARSIVVTRDITESERLDAMRRDFVANVSHELRTPLTVVNGFIQTLLDESVVTEPTHQRHLQLMHEQAMRMQLLVEDLLTLSRLESADNRLQDTSFEVGELVAQLSSEAQALSGGRHSFSFRVPKLRLRANADELHSALGNLLSNAIRYTPEGGRIELRWVMDTLGARFEVQDSGIGIAPAHIARLTERFYRVDQSRSRQTGGTGLGLAIVKHVLLRHGGHLSVQSQPGKGSIFCAWLPAARVL